MRWALRLTFWADAVLMGEGADLTVALAAWGAWWWCLWLGGRGGGARGLGGLVVVLVAWGAWRWCSRLGGLLSVRQSWLCLARSGGWFPKNVARNFHVNLSNFELASLELQRFWALLKVQAIELRATFGEARWLGGSGRGGSGRGGSGRGGSGRGGSGRGGAAARLALDDVDGQAALRGLLVLREHVVAGLAHRLDDDVQAHRVPTVAP